MIKIVSNERIRLLVYWGLTVIAFVFLAGGISNVEIRTGEILFEPRQEVVIEDDGTGGPTSTPATPTSPQSIVGLFSVAALFFVLFAAYRSPRIRNILLVALFFFGMFMGVLRLYQQYSQPEEGEEQAAEQSMLEKERLSAELLENPPDLVDWVSLAFTAGIVAVIGSIAWLVWQRRNYFLNRKPPLEIISEEVESTLAEIRSGAELRDAVLRCYADMGQALRRGLGLVRQEGMTPREFEEVLGRAELPRESVEQLTRLFEKVRYGGRIADEQDKHEAITCLESIVKAAGDQLEQPV